MATTSTSSTPTTSTSIKVIITKDKLSASVIVQPPSAEGNSATIEMLMVELKKAGVSFGIDEEAVKEAVEGEKFGNPIKVASGKEPGKGTSASFEYFFETNKTLKPVEDEQGKIDYHNINYIQNANKGDVLVVKHPPKMGEVGKNVVGEALIGSIGSDIPFKNGKNTEISDDGSKLIATESGAIVFTNNKVLINDVSMINGDIDFSIGNMDTKGSVIVSGNIKTGFKLNIDGDLEVNGNVDNCEINVKGNIFIKGGLIGKGNGKVHADGDITFKFAEGQNISAGGSLFIGDEAINCKLTAGDVIEVKSRAGKIVGGTASAGREIKAAILGSDAGTNTSLSVDVDKNNDKEIKEIKSEMGRLKADGSRIKQVILGLNVLKMKNKISTAQIETLGKLEVFQSSLPGNLSELESKIKFLREEFEDAVKNSIIGTSIVYPGVKASFGNVYKVFNNERSSTEMTLEINHVICTAYSPKS